MDKLINKISGLTFNGFYDITKDMIIVHFFDNNNLDTIAYLKNDMSWDVREISDERSVLKDDREIITIIHKNKQVREAGSDFDILVREGLIGMAKQQYGADTNLSDIDKMFKILEDNSY